MGFMDLSCAFDIVSHSKLWAALSRMGVESNLVGMKRDIYRGASAKVRFGFGGECTEPFNFAKGVQQECVLAPFLIILYISELEERLVEVGGDLPRVGRRLVPALLFADDAVLSGRTPELYRRRSMALPTLWASWTCK